MKKHSIRMLVFMLGAMTLAGCHKLQAITKIESDGSGALRIEVGFSAEERANIEKQNDNAQDFCNVSQTGPNVTVSEEQRGEETWCITTTQFKNLDELRSLYLQRMGVKVNRLEINDGKIYYDVEIDTLSDDSSFSALTEITWSVELPDTSIEHNADLVDGNVLIWKPAAKSGFVNFRAESQIPSPLNLPSCGAGLVGFGVVLIYLHRREKDSSLL